LHESSEAEIQTAGDMKRDATTRSPLLGLNPYIQMCEYKNVESAVSGLPRCKGEDKPLRKRSVLFLCTGNSCRSQMAEGLLRHMAGDRFEVFSAGTRPAGLNPDSVRAMQEVGIDIAGHRSKCVDEYAGRDFDFIITVCDSARQSCPVFPSAAARLHWDLEDPAAARGSDDERMHVFRSIRDEIAGRIREFLEKEAPAEEV
jgi:arsenate reductase (thioredoxin)